MQRVSLAIREPNEDGSDMSLSITLPRPKIYHTFNDTYINDIDLLTYQWQFFPKKLLFRMLYEILTAFDILLFTD